MAKEIPLTQGRVAIVDDEDFEWLSQWKWHWRNAKFRPRSTGYARRRVRKCEKESSRLMHRVILNAPPGMEVDHINGDGLDNRRCNLRLATPSQNTANCKRPITNKTGFRGVYPHRAKYRAKLSVSGRRVVGTLRLTPVEAAEDYNRLALKHHGEFATLNVIDEHALLLARAISANKPKKPATGYRGVWKHGNKFKAIVIARGKLFYGGIYATPIEAARAYNRLAIKHHGERAKLNNVDS